MKKKINKKIIFIIFILSLLSIIPLFYSDTIVFGHDTLFHLNRVAGVLENIKIGKIIPVYFKYLNGLGYANGLFYPDFFLYIPALLSLITKDIIISYKIFLYIINLFSLITMYITVKQITKNQKTSIYSTFLYAISFYRFSCYHARGALGECLAFVFIPLVILGLYKIFYDDEKHGYYLLIGLVGLVLSHVVSLYIMVFVIIAFVIINIKKLKNKQKLKYLLYYIFFSIIITSGFWAPLLEQLLTEKFNIVRNISIENNIVPIYMLFIDFNNTFIDEWMPAGIGIIYYYAVINYIRNKTNDKFLNTLYILGIALIILIIFPLIWKIDIFYNLFSIIQFPWRFYIPATVILLIALAVSISKEKIKKNMLKILTIYMSLLFILNCFIESFSLYCASDLITQNNIMIGEYLPKETAENFETYVYKNDSIIYYHEDNKLIVEILNDKNKELPLIYYKGYKATDRKKEYEVYKTENGYVGVNIDSETKKLEVYYDGTSIYKISKITAGIGLIIFIVIEIKKLLNKQQN